VSHPKLLIASCAALALACSLITNLDGITTTSDGGNSNSLDAKAPVVDAGADVKDAKSPADTATFCMGQDADFCADFDESANLKDGWDNIVTTGGAALVESTKFISPPRAIHAGSSNAISDAGFLKVLSNLGKGFELKGKTLVRIEADVRFESAVYGADDYTQFISWVAQGNMGSPTLGVTGIVRTGANGWAMATATMGPIVYYPMTTPPPEDKWTHMRAEVGLGTTGTLALWFDGAIAIAMTSASTATSTPSNVGVVVGYGAPSGYSPAVGMTCDNVVVTLLP